MTTRAVLYLRVSTEKQANRDLSIPNQRRQIQSFCDREKLKIVGEYSDAGIGER
jgi:site-specific DNA recombinase